MTLLSEYESFDALGLAELVQKKQVSPLDLVETAIDRIERRNASCNAVVHKMYDRAREQARGGSAGPFAGVPFFLKDLMAALQGEPLTSGSTFLRGFVPGASSELVSRFERAGLVFVAKTNTPEFGITPFTEPRLFGPSRNPWDTARTPGGSSGGAAAAVAARMVPMASGGDGGGSIRIPASCCGLFGLKPSRGRIPTGPKEGEGWEGFAIEHVITRSVRDSAAALDATCGGDVGAPYVAPSPARPFLEEVSRRPGRLRIAVTRVPLLGRELHADCVAAVDDAAALLRELGHDVVEATPVVDRRQFGRSMVIMLLGQTAAEVRDAEKYVGRRATYGDFESSTWLMRVLGETFSAGEYQSAVRFLQRQARALAVWAQPFDAWLTPTLGAPPVLIGELSSHGVIAAGEKVLGLLRLGSVATMGNLIEMVADKLFGFASFTPLANATGQPSMSVPLFWNAASLPVGVMLTARYGDEATLFNLAGQLESARPWKDRVPPGLA